jgi:hypothetical protein
MNVRRGFNRLSLVLYGLYLVAIAVWASRSVNSERSFWLTRIWQHEALCSQLNITPATRKAIDEALDVETDGRKAGSSFTPDPLGDLRNKAVDFDTRYLTKEQEGVCRRAVERATLTNTFKELFGGWVGWTLVVFIPSATYGFALAVGYTVRWVYCGFRGGNFRE